MASGRPIRRIQEINVPESENIWSLAGAMRLSRQQQIRVLAIAAAVALVLFGVGPWLWGLAFSPSAAPEPSLIPGTFRPTNEQWADLKFTRVYPQPFPGIAVTDGEIAANDDTTTQVFSPYSGRVTRLIAKLGDRVEKGDPLMTIAASEAVQTRNDLIAAVDALAAAEAQDKVAAANESRQHQLYMGQSAALKDWQQSQSDLVAARTALRTAETVLAEQRNRMRILGTSDGDIAALERSHTPEKLSSEATIVAPISGTVILRQIGLGQFIQSGASNPVYSIGDLSAVWVIGNVRENDAPMIQVGAPVDVRVIALPGITFSARLSWVAPSIDPTTHRLAVRAEVDNPGGILKPQMFATVRIHEGDDRMSLAVPENAVVYEGEDARVWIANKDKSLGLRLIKTGRDQDGRIEALSGLKSGDLIVTSGSLFIDRAAQPE
jgi:cobalt-zinc-cadmium efflux system membrane fusion protein